MVQYMTIREMWHYMVFQTKGYRRLQAAIVLGALTAAAVPYLNSVFYARILDLLLLSRYQAAVSAVVLMTGSLLVLNLVARGCERMVFHYCEPCEAEVKKRMAQKAFSMEYESIDRTETLAVFRRVRAGEQGMGGVQKQLLEIWQFFKELAGIAFAAGFLLVLFSRTDRAKESAAVSFLLPAVMIFSICAVLVLSSFFPERTGNFGWKRS